MYINLNLRKNYEIMKIEGGDFKNFAFTYK